MWFRRDLRWEDNAALSQALKSCQELWCLFVFDRDILDPLPRHDRRVEFICASLHELDQGLRGLADTQKPSQQPYLLARHGYAKETVLELALGWGVQAVFANHDDEPSTRERDAQVLGALAAVGVAFHTFKDHLIFERDDVRTLSGGTYSVFTPYRNAWLKKWAQTSLPTHPVQPHAGALRPTPPGWSQPLPSLQALGFEPTNLAALKIPTGVSGAQTLAQDFLGRIDQYHEAREFPAVKGPSYLGIHLRFGTVSVRQLALQAHQLTERGSQGARVWLSELIWRDFYAQILYHHPHVVGASFKPEYERIRWLQGPVADRLFQAWCEGRTGYPLVDAAMAQINQTGYMHNRLRMVTASFLVKDLGLDWRWGERYFAQHLNDFDLSSNNGGWQWASSSGCDSQPYFRIFNPVSQSQKFDPQGRFIRRYLPQLAALPDALLHAPWAAGALALHAAGVELGANYPHPVVAHEEARAQTLQRYAVVKKA